MRSFSLALASLMLLPAAASAADYLEPVAPVQAPGFTWTGLYAGAHAGYGWSDADWTLVDNASPGACGRCGSVVTSSDADGFLGGVQVGYNYQFENNIVLGAEAEVSFGDMSGAGSWAASDGPRDAAFNFDAMLTAGPKLGLAADHWLFYGEGGLAALSGEYTHRNYVSGNTFRDDASELGWFVGGGVEYAFNSNWSTRVEYNYVDFGGNGVNLSGTRSNGTPGTAVFDVDQSFQVVKVGLNYHF